MSCTKGIQTSGHIQVKFYNEITGLNEMIGTYATHDEADAAISKKEIEFYSKNTHLLPKGVIVSKTTFRLQTSRLLLTDKNDCVVGLASAKTIKEIRILRTKVIKSLLDI